MPFVEVLCQILNVSASREPVEKLLARYASTNASTACIVMKFANQFKAVLIISGYGFSIFQKGVGKSIAKVFPEQF